MTDHTGNTALIFSSSGRIITQELALASVGVLNVSVTDTFTASSGLTGTIEVGSNGITSDGNPHELHLHGLDSSNVLLFYQSANAPFTFTTVLVGAFASFVSASNSIPDYPIRFDVYSSSVRGNGVSRTVILPLLSNSADPSTIRVFGAGTTIDLPADTTDYALTLYVASYASASFTGGHASSNIAIAGTIEAGGLVSLDVVSVLNGGNYGVRPFVLLICRPNVCHIQTVTFTSIDFCSFLRSPRVVWFD